MSAQNATPTGRLAAFFLNSAPEGGPPEYGQVAKEYEGSEGTFPLYFAATPRAELSDEDIKAAFQAYGTGRLDGFTAAVRSILATRGTS